MKRMAGLLSMRCKTISTPKFVIYPKGSQYIKGFVTQYINICGKSLRTRHIEISLTPLIAQPPQGNISNISNTSRMLISELQKVRTRFLQFWPKTNSTTTTATTITTTQPPLPASWFLHISVLSSILCQIYQIYQIHQIYQMHQVCHIY